jgi:hypothetical protein
LKPALVVIPILIAVGFGIWKLAKMVWAAFSN